MGKAVEAIALVLAQSKLKKATSGSSILPSSPATQWFREIERCTTKGSNKTLADYWPKKSKQNSKNSKWSDDGSIENSAWVGEDVSTRKSVSYELSLVLITFAKIYITKPLVTMGHENDDGDAMVIMRKVSLDVSEFNYYKSLHNRSREQFDRLVQAGTLINNYGHIFAMITCLRQVTSCRHVFCKACLIGLAESVEKMPCPSCTKLLTFDFTANNDKGDSNYKPTVKGFRSSSILNGIQLDKFQTNTKIDALLSGINCVQLVGSMSIAATDAAVNKFTEDSDCRILLMSLKAGAVALNLTVASNVFLMDPWWNPAVEQQAQDRIHRIGQYKPVWIVRFVIEKTIEENIVELQEKKKLLFEGTVGGSSEALGKLTMEDLSNLLQPHF
ncbi:hypothetical protein H5410_064968 [Solanum commersonii]|uniref:Helicase C-terminal domain-containing protein n=1 Tax=Solanum commersonii TaxID=4109 RepID=A0A9J5VXW1_SOLCO|nr:hypothetical protein H5410_064968 [Solanum commersonii]